MGPPLNRHFDKALGERQVVEMGVTPVWAEEEQRRKEIQKEFVNEEVRAWATKAQ